MSVIGVLIGIFVFAATQSFKMPRERTSQVITRLGKFYTCIMAVRGHHFDPEWNIVPDQPGHKKSLSEKWNVYFFLWPIYKTHVYPFTYPKLKRVGEEKSGDVVIWKDDESGECIVSRTGVSNYIDFHTEYPVITPDLRTEEMARVKVLTTNTIQAVNPFKMLFGINNWLGVTMETINGALRGIVGGFSMHKLNQVKSEYQAGQDGPTSDFTEQMTWINLGREGVQDGIEERWGVRLTRSIFKSFSPEDEAARELLASFAQPEIAAQKAHAYSREQAAIVEWRKKYLVDTGLAKVDEKGNITDLVPDANVRVGAEALKELAKLKGTLVTGEGGVQAMLGLNASHNKEE
ncbi:MAG TPA: hypothetical protein VJB95_03290 [Candidatus Paceibacterota bacterium]